MIGLTKEQWMDAIEDIQTKVFFDRTQAEGVLPEMLFAEMKHCIGLDYKRPYMRGGMYFYRPYRNDYDAGPRDEPMWEALVEKTPCMESNDVSPDNQRLLPFRVADGDIHLQFK